MSKLTEEDKRLFRNSLRGIQPLSPANKITLRSRTHKPSPPIKTKEKIREIPFSDEQTLDLVGGEDLLQFNRDGLQHKVLRKLRRGQYNVEAILDLHGKRVTEAREKLSHFLLTCQQQGICHVLVIHGKGRGQPILKNKLNHWLRQTDIVQAFCSATPQQGSGGALYVLLRKRR